MKDNVYYPENLISTKMSLLISSNNIYLYENREQLSFGIPVVIKLYIFLTFYYLYFIQQAEVFGWRPCKLVLCFRAQCCSFCEVLMMCQ